MKKVLLGASGLLLLVVIAWAAWPSDTELPPAPADETAAQPKLEQQLAALEQTASTGDGGRSTVHGTVVDGDGNPVPAARVEVWRAAAVLTATCSVCGSALIDDNDPKVGRELMEMIRSGKLARKVIAETVAGPDGAFDLEVPNEQLTFHASTAGGSSGEVERDADEEEVEVAVAPRQPSRLKVVTGEDEVKPVPSAHLFVASRDSFRFVEVFTDEGGLATVPDLESDGGLWVFAEAKGFGGQVVPLVMHTDPEAEGDGDGVFEEVRLSPSRSLLVRTTAGGKPVDATVRVSAEGHPRELKAHGGEARFDDLTTWDLEVNASLGPLAAPKHVVSLDRELTEVDVELRQAAKALVTVVDEGGQPVAASLNLVSDEDQLEGQSTEKGELVTLGPVAEGSYQLSVQQSGYRMVERTVDLKPGDNPVEVVLRKSSGLKGQVVDEHGKGVSGVSVEARVPPNPLVVSNTDEDGKFELEIEEPGPVDLTASNAEHGKAEAHVTAPNEQVVLHLLPRARLKVHVLSPEGKPERAMVLVNRRGTQEAAVQSSADGEAEFAGLDPGEVETMAVARRLNPPAGKKVTLEEGRLAEVTLTLDPGLRASGTVVDTTGKPLNGVQLLTNPMAGAAASDAEGHFELEGLEAGTTYQLDVEDDVYEAQPAVTFKAGQTLKVVLGARPKVHGRVIGSGGAPVASFEVEGNPIEAADGRFEVAARQTDGQLFLVVSAKDYKTWSYEGPYKADLGDVVLEGASEAFGLVVDESGKPVSGAVVSPASGEVTVTTGSGGTFRMKLVEDSDTISARRGQAKGSVPLELGRQLRIVLSGPTEVSGRVLDDKGRPVAAVVTARDVDSNTVKADSGNDGRFQLELAQGPWVFSTRLSMAGQFVEVKGAQMEVTLGAPPGTCGLSVRANAPMAGVVLLPGDVASEGDLLSPEQHTGAVLLESYGANVARAAGLPCGTYTLFASFVDDTARQVVQVRSQDLVVEVAEPVPGPPSPQPAPAGEGTRAHPGGGAVAEGQALPVRDP